MESEVWSIKIKPSVKKDLGKLPPAIRSRLGKAISGLAADPRPPGAKKLAGENSLFRLRVDSFRVVYQVQDRVLTVLVVRVGDRKEVYRKLERISRHGG